MHADALNEEYRRTFAPHVVTELATTVLDGECFVRAHGFQQVFRSWVQFGRTLRRKSPPLACQTACSAALSAARTARLARQNRRRGTVGSAIRSLR